MEIVTASEGGTISTRDGSVRIAIPAGAITVPTGIADHGRTIFVTETGTLYQIGTGGIALFGVNITPGRTPDWPDSLTFNFPATIVFAWQDDDNDGWVDGTNIVESNLVIIHGGQIITEECSTDPGCDDQANTFTFEVTQLSVFELASLLAGEGPAVGGTASLANKIELLVPWIAITALILLSAGVIIRRFKKQS
jgi:hypothetical protein